MVNDLLKLKRLHFIGIGGEGMSALAELMAQDGYHISGSDLLDNAAVKRLKALGIPISQSHCRQYLSDAQAVVISSAVAMNNPEVLAAQQLQLPIFKRGDLLATIMRLHDGIAVAGSHGKTTTTGLIISLLIQAGLDPSFAMGGCLQQAQANGGVGSGKYFVAESDESDGSFLALRPKIAVITNINADHLETYQGSLHQLKQAFVQFINQLDHQALVIICQEDSEANDILLGLKTPYLTYGLNCQADIWASDVDQQPNYSSFLLHRAGKENLAITINLPGQHNILNALAAIAVADQLNIDDATIQLALARFQGVKRRFEQLGNCQFSESTVWIVHDYGHHPRELAVIINAARQTWPAKKIAMVFQPHRYTRTRDLFNEFVEVLSQSDLLYLLPVYAASEAVIDGADSEHLYQVLVQKMVGRCHYVAKPFEQLPSILQRTLDNNSVLFMQGAGDIGQLAAELYQHYRV